MSHIHKSVLVNASLEGVHEFATDPRSWHEWWIGLGKPEEVFGNGEPGTIVRHHYRMTGLDLPVTTTVVEDLSGPRECRWKGEFEGGLAGRQVWLYVSRGELTEVIVDIDYTIPGRVLDRIADRSVIERLEEKAIEHTLENLKLYCEAGIATIA